jgi:hypothetical protein
MSALDTFFIALVRLSSPEFIEGRIDVDKSSEKHSV